MTPLLDQVAIPLLGVTAVWLSQDARPRIARWACLVGLCSQPFWLHATWIAGQWGIFISSLFYTFGWLRGVRTFWTAARPTLLQQFTTWWCRKFHSAYGSYHAGVDENAHAVYRCSVCTRPVEAP